MLTTLIYRSQLSLTCTSAALSALVEQARIRNTEQGISGILLSRGHDVLQILEGTEQSVVALFNTIRADDRHTGVVELMRDYGPRRRFDNVGMLLFDLDVETPKAVLASVLHYSNHFWASYTLLVIAGAAMYAPYGPFFAIIPEMLPRNVAGGAMALINSMGALGSFFGSWFVGYLNGATGSPSASYIFMGVALFASVWLTLIVKPANNQQLPVGARHA